MNRRQLFMLFVAWGSVEESSSAEKFWSRKPWRQWKLSEAQSLILNSPWVHSVYLDPSGYPGPPSANIGAYRRIFFVRWRSARIIRLARERRALLKPSRLYSSELSSALVTKYYIIEVDEGHVLGGTYNPSLSELGQATFGELSEVTSLSTRINKLRLATYSRATERQGGLFLFERSNALGQPTFSIDQDQVLFETSFRSGARILEPFKLKDMVFEDSLDL